MRIKDILAEKGSDVVTIDARETVRDAICRLNEHGIGALIVTGEGGEICGIVTERDILQQCGEGCTRLLDSEKPEPKDCPAPVQDVMTKDLVIGVPDDHIDYVMGIMTKNRIRHLPVLNGSDLAGIISIGDVVNAHMNEKEFENRLLKDYIHGVKR